MRLPRGSLPVVPAALLAILLAGCRSPVQGLGPETGPPSDPERIGTAIHGWPMLETAWHGTTHRTDVLWPLATWREALEGPPPRPDSFLPLLVHGTSPEGRRWGLRPLFDVETRTREDGPVEDVDLLFPIVKWRTEPDASLFEFRPIVWSKRSEDASRLVVFPLYGHWEKGDAETTFVLPSYYARTIGEKSDLHLWPLWGRRTEGTWTKDWTLFPFFGWGRDADPERDRWEIDAPAPLVHFGRDGEETSARVLPLFWHERGPEDRTTVVFPFWWSIHDRDDGFDMVFPFHASWRGRDSDGEAWLLNAWVRHRSGDETTRHVLAPLLGWSESPDRWSAHLWPVVWLDRGPEESTTHVWPLFGHERDGGSTTVSTIWPFFTCRTDAESWAVQAPAPLVKFAGGPDRS